MCLHIVTVKNDGVHLALYQIGCETNNSNGNVEIFFISSHSHLFNTYEHAQFDCNVFTSSGYV